MVRKLRKLNQIMKIYSIDQENLESSFGNLESSFGYSGKIFEVYYRMFSTPSVPSPSQSLYSAAIFKL